MRLTLTNSKINSKFEINLKMFMENLYGNHFNHDYLPKEGINTNIYNRCDMWKIYRRKQPNIPFETCTS